MPRAERLAISTALALALFSAFLYLSPPPRRPVLPERTHRGEALPKPEPLPGWAQSLVRLFEQDAQARPQRPPPPPLAHEGEKAAIPDDPSPALSWLGVVSSPSGTSTCLFRDESSLSCFSLEKGKEEGGWRLLEMGEESCLLERNGLKALAWRKR